MGRWCSVLVVGMVGACGGPADDDVPAVDAAAGPTLDPEPAAVYILGDSISANIGASEPELGWGPLFRDRIDALVDAPLEYVNVAVPGATTVELVGAQLDALAEQVGTPAEPVIVGITIGGNDLRAAIATNPLDVAGDTLDRVEQNLIVVGDWFADAERFPAGVTLYVANVYNPHAGSNTIEAECYGWSEDRELGFVVDNLLDMWSARYAEVGDAHGFTVVDARAGFADHSRIAEDTWFADCMHPNDAGHAAMRDLFYAAAVPAP